MTTSTPPPTPPAPQPPSIPDRLAAIEKRLDEAKNPADKDRWDKFEKISSGLWVVVTFFVSLFVTNRIETALKERELHLENVKDMQEMMVQFHGAAENMAMSPALALGAHGRYSAVPFIQELQAGVPGHRPAAEAGLRAAAAIDHAVVCEQLVRVIENRTRLYQFEVHESAIRLLADLECLEGLDALGHYRDRLSGATLATTPFTCVNPQPPPAPNDPSAENLALVKSDVQRTFEALQSVKSERSSDESWWHRWFGGWP